MNTTTTTTTTKWIWNKIKTLVLSFSTVHCFLPGGTASVRVKVYISQQIVMPVNLVVKTTLLLTVLTVQVR